METQHAHAEAGGTDLSLVRAGDDEIHYAEELAEDEAVSPEASVLRQAELYALVMPVLFGLLAVPAAVVLTLTGSLRANLVTVIVSYVAVLVVAGVAISYIAVRSAASAPAPRIARRSDPQRRVRWVGSKERAPKARPADSESFEPVFFRAWLPSDDPARAVPRLIALGIAAVVIYLGLRFAEVRGPAMVATAAFAVAACAVVLMLLFPTWYRFSPGRLDVLRFSLGRHLGTESWDLSSARILVEGSWVHIEQEGRRYSLAAPMLRTAAFQRAALHAANCQAPTPDLPADRLLG